MSVHLCILEYIWICVTVYMLNYHPKYLMKIFSDHLSKYLMKMIILQATLSAEMAIAVDAITGQMTAAESHDDCFQKRYC